MALEKGSWFLATYEPRAREDLDPVASEWIGWTGLWEAAFVIENGPCAGQWACVVKKKRDGSQGPNPHPPAEAFDWVPQADLAPIPISPKAEEAIRKGAEEILEAKKEQGG